MIRRLILILVFALAGCATQRPLNDGSYAAEDVLLRVKERNALIQTMHGYGTMSISSPELSNTAGFNIDLRMPDSLLAELYGPFGIHAATLFLSTHEFVVLNRLEATAIRGIPDSASMLAALHVAIPFETILGIFTGSLFPRFESSPEFVHEDGAYRFVFKSNSQTIEYLVDDATYLVTSMTITGDDGILFMSAKASRIVRYNEIPMPRQISVSFPGEDRKISLTYDDIIFNDSVRCAFKLPEKVRIITP